MLRRQSSPVSVDKAEADYQLFLADAKTNKNRRNAFSAQHHATAAQLLVSKQQRLRTGTSAVPQPPEPWASPFQVAPHAVAFVATALSAATIHAAIYPPALVPHRLCRHCTQAPAASTIPVVVPPHSRSTKRMFAVSPRSTNTSSTSTSGAPLVYVAATAPSPIHHLGNEHCAETPDATTTAAGRSGLYVDIRMPKFKYRIY